MGDRPVPGALLSGPGAALIDLDGTVYTNDGLVPGADRAIAALRSHGVPFRFVTNTTRRPRAGLVARLRSYGIEVAADEIFTAVRAGARVLAARGVRTVAPFVASDTQRDLAEFDLRGGTSGRAAATRPDAVVIGDLGAQWTPVLLNEAFRAVLDGALLVALQRDRYWLGDTGLEMDAGPYVAALEFASGKTALVSGKPSAEFYRAALASLDAAPAPADTAMIGDDLWSDVEGAQRAGLQGWLVQTGKFRADVLKDSGIRPDRVLASLADLAVEVT